MTKSRTEGAVHRTFQSKKLGDTNLLDFEKMDFDSRAHAVFERLVDVYLKDGEPVSSRTLSGTSGLNVSAATIRNIMADLEDLGLLYAPHPSAGRLPTQTGLRLFVDAMLKVGNVRQADQNRIQRDLEGIGDLRNLLDRACQKLSGLTRLAGLVVAPNTDRCMRHVEFVRISTNQALAIIVTDDGLVENRLIKIPSNLNPSSLQEAANFIRSRFEGRTLSEIRSAVDQEVKQHQHELNRLTKKLINIGVGTSSNDREKGDIFIVHGHSAMLEDADVQADLDRMRSIFKILEQQQSLKKVLEKTEEAEGVQVFIGAENSLFSLTGCSAIVAPIRTSSSRGGSKILGAIGVIGPSHMNYGRILPMVDFTARIICEHIGESEAT